MFFTGMIPNAEHIVRVVEWAIYLSSKHKIPIQQATLAALYHDIGRTHATQLHAEVGSDLFSKDEQFAHIRANLSQDEIKLIALAIRQHCSCNNSERSTMLSKIIYDAERVGYSGIQQLKRFFQREETAYPAATINNLRHACKLYMESYGVGLFGTMCGSCATVYFIETWRQLESLHIRVQHLIHDRKWKELHDLVTQ